MALSLLCAPLVHRAAPFSLIVKSITTPHYESLGLVGLFPNKQVTNAPAASIARFSSSMPGRYATKKLVKQSVDVFVGSPEQLVQPYLPPLRQPSIFTWTGVKSRWTAVKNVVLSFLASLQMKESLKLSKEKWDKGKFLVYATKCYKDINTAIAAHNVQQLRTLVTESMLKKLDQLGLLKSGPVLNWKCDIWRPKILTVRYARMATGAQNYDFAQITVQFRGTQTLSLQNGEEKTSIINEYWVFERSLLQKESKWRLCHQSAPLVGS